MPSFRLNWFNLPKNKISISSGTPSLVYNDAHNAGNKRGLKHNSFFGKMNKTFTVLKGRQFRWRYFATTVILLPIAAQCFYNSSACMSFCKSFVNKVNPKSSYECSELALCDDMSNCSITIDSDDPSTFIPVEDQYDKQLRKLELDVVLEDNKSNDQKSINPEKTTLLSPNVVSFNVSQINSNVVNEDKYFLAKTERGLIFGVFDGHLGLACSSVLEKYFSHYLTKELDMITKGNVKDPYYEMRIKHALIKAFNKIDNDIINGGFSYDPQTANSDVSTYKYLNPRNALLPAFSGSCGIIAYIEDDCIYIANTGDSKAIIGEYSGHGNRYNVLNGNVIHTFNNPSERVRMGEEHPGESRYAMIQKSRLFGYLIPSRSFGDAAFKLNSYILDTLYNKKYITRKYVQKDLYKTPPYLTAEPTVTRIKINPNKTRFLVLSSDGITDVLSNSEIVEIVRDYYNNFIANKLPSDYEHIPYLKSNVNATKLWTMKDTNISTILIRNAINNGFPNYERSILTVSPPNSRRIRDDMTALVVFFGNSDTVNTMASNKKILKKIKLISGDCFSQAPCVKLEDILKQFNPEYVKPKENIILDLVVR